MKKIKLNKIIRILRIKNLALFLFAGFLLYSCSENPTPTVKDTTEPLLVVPKGFPQPEFPEDNPYSEAKAELGRKLFYEKMLSPDSSLMSCSHCHKQAFAFGGNTQMAVGFNHEVNFRNPKPHENVVYRKLLLWDGRQPSMEDDAYQSIYLPFLLSNDTNVLAKRLEANPQYKEMFKKAFGENVKISATLAAKAIATFQRTLISGESPYDDYINGDKSALNESQKRGMDLFFSDKTRCSVCHSGLFFNDGKFHNNGALTHYFDRGLFEVTKNNSDRGKFLTPTLRNIEVTAPYMSNGDFTTLKSVIEHYNQGGSYSVLKDTLIRQLYLTEKEKTDLLNFLKSLTDRKFLTNPKFAPPN